MVEVVPVQAEAAAILMMSLRRGEAEVAERAAVRSRPARTQRNLALAPATTSDRLEKHSVFR